MRTCFSTFALWGAVTLSLLLLSGCISDGGGSGRTAFVEIFSHGVEAVRQETLRVFSEDNYQLTGAQDGILTFEREATQREQVMYGRYGETLSMRVFVTIEPRHTGGCGVMADAFVLRGSFEDKVLRMARRPYQDLLNRVRGNLATAQGVERADGEAVIDTGDAARVNSPQ